MTYGEFKKKLQENNIPESKYCYNDNVKDGVMCIRKNYQGWEVFYRERGNEFYNIGFPSEENALDYLFEKLMKTKKIWDDFNVGKYDYDGRFKSDDNGRKR